MRHGRSLANEAGIIVSSLEEGSESWGLANGAEEQISTVIANSDLSGKIRIISSPFLRAKQTAEIVSRLLDTPSILVKEGLRERFFGQWDGTRDDFYQDVWAGDLGNPENRYGGVESPEDVLKRVLGVLNEIEKSEKSENILLVSHGDPLDILLAHADGLGPEEHRSIDCMKTAEIRPLRFQRASSSQM